MFLGGGTCAMRCDGIAALRIADGDGDGGIRSRRMPCGCFFFSILDVQGMRPPQLTVMMLLPSVKFQSSLYTPRTHEHSLGSLMCMMTMTLNEDVTPFSFLAS